MADLNFIIEFGKVIDLKRREELCDLLRKESPSTTFYEAIFEKYPSYRQVFIEGKMPKEDYERLFGVQTEEIVIEKDSPLVGGPYYFQKGIATFPFPEYEDARPRCRLKTIISRTVV